MIGLNSEIEDIQIAAEFIEELKHVKLDDSNMLPEDIAHLHEAPKDFPFDVDDPNFQFLLQTFLATTNASQDVYNSFCGATHARYPENVFLSLDKIKHCI